MGLLFARGMLYVGTVAYTTKGECAKIHLAYYRFPMILTLILSM
jgi:hypothetical protein